MEIRGAVLFFSAPEKSDYLSPPATASAAGKNAHMAIYIRVMDVASGRVVAAKRISGSAASYKATAGTAFDTGQGPIPVSLGALYQYPHGTGHPRLHLPFGDVRLPRTAQELFPSLIEKIF